MLSVLVIIVLFYDMVSSKEKGYYFGFLMVYNFVVGIVCNSYVFRVLLKVMCLFCGSWCWLYKLIIYIIKFIWFVICYNSMSVNSCGGVILWIFYG